MDIDSKRKSEPLCRIRDVYRAINNYETQMQQAFGIGLNEGMLLCSLHTLGKCSSGYVAELLGLTLSNASKVITSAEKKGLVQRVVGEQDKRQMLFTLTAEGMKRIDSVKCKQSEMLDLLSKIKEM